MSDRLSIGSLIAATGLLLGHTTLVVAGDRDHDGLRDSFEARWGTSDPLRRDTDRDGTWDALEDGDEDRLSDRGEQHFATDPTDPDSDRDGRNDGQDDSDRDGIEDALEQDSRPVPPDLEPPLADAYWDMPPGYHDGCHAGVEADAVTPCASGARRGRVRIALFGDSHALQWLPALDRAGQQRGWRITALTKSACPSVDVAFDFEGFSFEPTCRRWRSAALGWLMKHPQHVVVITNEGRYPLVDARGERVFREQKEPLWQEGLATVIDKLPARTRIIVLADTPHLVRNPVSCLARARIISECVSRRADTLVPRHDQAERRTARAHHALFGRSQRGGLSLRSLPDRGRQHLDVA